MAMTVRPRRSVLYMPGSNPRAMEKGKTLQADGLILDLEDAVAPDAKAQARTQIGDAIKGGGYGKRELIVRTNGLNTAWGYEDLVFAATSGAALMVNEGVFAETKPDAATSEGSGDASKPGVPMSTSLPRRSRSRCRTIEPPSKPSTGKDTFSPSRWSASPPQGMSRRSAPRRWEGSRRGRGW